MRDALYVVKRWKHFSSKKKLEIFRAQTSVSIFLGLELMPGPENIHWIANLSSTNILDMNLLGQN